MNTDQRLPDRHEVVIVGGGISGLAAAWALRDRDVRLLEAEDRVGGRMKSVSRPPYWLNLGAHILMENGIIADLCRQVAVPIVVPRGRFVAAAMHGHIVRAGGPLGLFFRLPLPISARLSLAGVGLRLMTAQRRMRSRSADRDASTLCEEKRSFADLLGPMHPDVEALLRVIANRIGGEMRELSAYAGVIGFHDIWGGERVNIVGGSQRLPEALQAALGPRVQTGVQVTRIEHTGEGVEIEYVLEGERQQVHADACIVTTQAPFTREIIRDLPPERAEQLGKVRYTPFVVAGIFTAETSAMPWDDLYALAVPGRSFCMFFNPGNAVRHGKRREPGGSLVVYSVADRAAQLLDLSDTAITERYLKDLCQIFPQANGIVREVVIQRWPLGVPLHFPGRTQLHAGLAKPWGRVHFAGDYVAEFGLGIESSAELGRRAAEAVHAHLSRDAGT